MTTKLIAASGIASSTHGVDTAVLVQDGRIKAIGKSDDLARPGMDLIDHGRSLLSPILHDHHFHPIGYAAAVNRLSLKDAIDLADLESLLREASTALGPGEALIGNRLDDETLAEKRLPSREELDAMVADRPVLLYRYCGHVAVVNTAALNLAGLAANSPGILTETAIQPVANVVSAAQAPLEPASIHRALAGLASLGLGRLTAIVSAGEPIWCDVPDEIGTLLEVASDLPIDFEVLVIATDPAELEQAARRLDRSGDNVSFRGWKDFADGSLGGRTAALYEPYEDDPASTGTVRIDREHFLRMARVCQELGGLVAIHAIGDRANDLVLDLFEELIEVGVEPASLQIEHASMLTDSAIERMAHLGITASVQPAFLPSESSWLSKRLGGRTKWAYPLAKLDAAGVRLLGGSDCPVERPNPWWGIASARELGGLSPQAAFDLFAPPLKVGDPANLLVIDRDPITTNQVASTKVLAAYRKGAPITIMPELTFR